jgi:hypothetical protein
MIPKDVRFLHAMGSLPDTVQHMAVEVGRGEVGIRPAPDLPLRAEESFPGLLVFFCIGGHGGVTDPYQVELARNAGLDAAIRPPGRPVDGDQVS